jgi:hypothetical protein
VNSEKIWQGITYPPILDAPWIHRLWVNFMCPRGWHLFDECLSLESHSLFCDACGLDVVIKGFRGFYKAPAPEDKHAR